MENESAAAPAPPVEPSKPARTTWETVLTTTPVILTVLGTLLAGLSSSEMTLAQYHRSLAAQSQSKAGDQWGFFQAKRIRGQGLEATVELMPVIGRFGTVSPETLQSAADRVVQRCQRAIQDAERLQQAINATEKGSGPDGEARATAASLVRAAQEAKERAETTRKDLDHKLREPKTRSAFTYLRSTAMPETRDLPTDPKVEELLRDIADRKPEREVVSAVTQMPEEQVQQALEDAEANARSCERAGKPVSRSLEELIRVLNADATAAALLHAAVRSITDALLDLPERKESAEVRAALDAMTRSATAVRTAAEELMATFSAARLDYEARRYRREASYNQTVAGVHEILVRKQGAASERHRERSKKFFYGMLCAQAGVAIASMALAARLKSVLWALAGVAGLGALLFSGYVYLYH